MKHKRLTTLIACLLVSAVGVPTALGTTTSKPVVKKVQVEDNLYSPTKVTIKKRQQVNWIWSNSNFNTHSVTLIKGPNGVNKHKFSSTQASMGFHFKLTFLKTGTYHFQCMVHPFEMNMTVTVKK
ncbi:MAG: plastocyanin/azurin family copper-binding protein [Solirubrobacteraceae bacterium]